MRWSSQTFRLHRWQWLLVWLVATAAMVSAATLRVPPLTTVDHSRIIQGKFVWADLITDDLKTVRTFYGRMFGWTFRGVGNYTIVHNHERPLCGMLQQARPKDRPAQPRWLAYMSVTNLVQTQNAVTKAGGRVLSPPARIPDRGEQAVFADAEGAVFGAIKSFSGDPQDFLPDRGDWIWIQLLSHDSKGAAEFYRAVGEYEVRENNSSGRLSDYVLVSDGYARAAIRTASKTNTKGQATWLPFVRVDKVGESVEQARRLGGKVLIEPSAKLFDGKVAVIADPSGAAIGIMEWPEEALKGGR